MDGGRATYIVRPGDGDDLTQLLVLVYMCADEDCEGEKVVKTAAVSL
jgi:hypothetical protein